MGSNVESPSFHNWYKANKQKSDWPYLLIMEGEDNEQGYWFFLECMKGNKECLNKDVLTIAALVNSTKMIMYKSYFEKDYPKILELAAYQQPKLALQYLYSFIVARNDLVTFCCKKEPRYALHFLLDFLATNVDLFVECIKAAPEYAFSHDKVLNLLRKKKSKQIIYDIAQACPDYCLDKLSELLGKYYPTLIDSCITILEQRSKS